MDPDDSRPRPMAGSSAIGADGLGSTVLPDSLLRSLKAIEMFLMSDDENPEFQATGTSSASVYANCNFIYNTDGTDGNLHNTAGQDSLLIEFARGNEEGSTSLSFCTAATDKLKKRWSSNEDMLLKKLVKLYGAQNWSAIAMKILGRNAKQCKERWFNQLDPEIKNDPWCQEEERILVEGHRMHGNKWSAIASLLPGRPENAIKNKWHTSKRKLERNMNSINHGDHQTDVRSKKKSKNSNLSVLGNYIQSTLFEGAILATASEPTSESSSLMATLFEGDVLATISEPTPGSSSLMATSSMEGFLVQTSDLFVSPRFQAFDIDYVRKQLMTNMSAPPQGSSHLILTSTEQVFSVPNPSLPILSSFEDHTIDRVKKKQLMFDIFSPTSQSSPLLTATRGEGIHFPEPQEPWYESNDVENSGDELLVMNDFDFDFDFDF